MCIKYVWETDMSLVAFKATKQLFSAQCPAQISFRNHGLIGYNMGAWSGICAVRGKQGLVSISAALKQSSRKESVLWMI